MKYYLIVGEASGDLHASNLMRALREEDSSADFRFIGGDLMTAVGGVRLRHYKEMAYMGFIPVLLHLKTIFSNMSLVKQDIVSWQPDALILVDYPGFNLGIAKYIHKNTKIPVYYYISPKIWAWKEFRIKNIKRDVDAMFSILPFEVPFYEQKHGYKINYVGNPTEMEVREFLKTNDESSWQFCERNGLDVAKPIIALLSGSRKQEIKDNLPMMLKATSDFADYQMVVAGAPGIEMSYYDKFLKGSNVRIVNNETYQLLAHSKAALVTSGTATLETAMFGVPQVVCYKTPLPKIVGWLRKKVLNVEFISLVNLIAGREVVAELVADTFTLDLIRGNLYNILPGQPLREPMLQGYEEVKANLGQQNAPQNAAKKIVSLLRN